MKDLAKKRAASLKQEIKESNIQQVIKPTFDKSAWQAGGKSTYTGQPSSKPNGTSTVHAASNVLKTGGFNRSAWQPSGEKQAPPESLTPSKPMGFNREAWKPKNGQENSQEGKTSEMD